MGLFPQPFLEELKHHADIVVVIQDYMSPTPQPKQ